MDKSNLDLLDLLSQRLPPDAHEFTDFLSNALQLHLSDAEEKRWPGDGVYYNWRSDGISFFFKYVKDTQTLKLDAVHIYGRPLVVNARSFQPFSKYNAMSLPYGITSDTLMIDFIKKFAPLEPRKGGGGRDGMDIWCEWPEHGIHAQFAATNWSHQGQVRWTEVVFSRVFDRQDSK